MAISADFVRPKWSRDNSTELRRLSRRLREHEAEKGANSRDAYYLAKKDRHAWLQERLNAAMGAARA